METIETLERREHSYIETITFDGKPVAIIGMVIAWRGCGTVWSVTSDGLEDAPEKFNALVLEMIEEYTRVFKLWRLQFNVLANFRLGIRWAKQIGFSSEGLMQKFDPEGRDYYRFARIFNV